MRDIRKGLLVINYDSLFATAFLLWPILNTYGFINETIGVGDIVILLVSGFVLLKKGITNNERGKSYYIKYFITTVFLSFIAYAFTVTGNSYGIVLSLFRRIVYVVVFSIIAPYLIDSDILLKEYKKICFLLGVVVYIQVLLKYVNGYSEPFIINSNLFPVRDVGGFISYINNWHIHLTHEAYKAPSLFTEASKYAHYVVPCLLLSLVKERRNYSFEVFISMSLILTFSANAVVFMIVAWCCWILFARNNKNNSMKYIVSVLGIAALITLLLGDNWFTLRLNEIGNGMTSGSMRVLRGWIIYGMLPVINQVIGVGIGNVSSYIEITGIRTGFDAGYLGYMSGLSEVAVASGFISLVLFLLLLFKYFKRGGSTGRSITVLLLVMLLSSAIYETPSYGICVLILECSAKTIIKTS